MGDFEKAAGDLLKLQGWYRNDGWRRQADARAGGAMPPALSTGEAIDETIGAERARLAEAERLRIRLNVQRGCSGCGAEIWRRGDEYICINVEECELAVPLRPGEVAR